MPDRWRLGPAFVPKGRYTDPEFLDLELERLFPRTWLNACRVDEVERVGDYVDFEIGDQSIVVVRTEEGLRAYFNACRHRGTRLVQGAGPDRRVPLPLPRLALEPGRVPQVPGRRGQLRPPAAGRALPARSAGSTPGAAGSSSTWMPGAEPLADYLDPIPARLDGFKLEDMRIAWYKSVVLPANWKTALDAFIESWHVPGTHPQLLRPDKHHTPPTIAECEQYGGRPSTSCSATTRATPTSSATAPDGDATKLRRRVRRRPQARLHERRTTTCASCAPST